MEGEIPVNADSITNLAQSCSEHAILRRFGRPGVVLNTFLQQLTDKFVKDHIRPFIDKQMHEIFLMALLDHVPIFKKSVDGRLLDPSGSITFDQRTPEPWFCFTRRKDGSEYRLEILIDDKVISLRDPGTAVLTDTPCWLLWNQRLIRFGEGFEGKKLTPFLSKNLINIPVSAEKAFFSTFFLKTLKTGQVKADGFEVQTLVPERSARLSMEIDWLGRPVLILWFHYDERRVMRGKKQRVFTEMKEKNGQYTFFRWERDLVWESQIYQTILDSGLVPDNENILLLPGNTGIQTIDTYRIVEWINANRGQLDEIPVIICQEGLRFHLGTVFTRISTDRGMDWFDIYGVVVFGEMEIPFYQIKDYILDGIREFPLPDGTKAILPEEWFIRYYDLFALGTGDGTKIRLQKRHYKLVDLLDLRLPDGVQYTQDTGQQTDFEINSGFTTHLRPYQKAGVLWMAELFRNNWGGCLADDMGLGKTIQMLAFLRQFAGRGEGASLIVMPASLIHNWKNEILRFASDLRYLIHTGNQRTRDTAIFAGFDLVLTTYGICRNDQTMLSQYSFFYVILDESQMIRNPEALTSQAVYSLQSRYRLVLTGTPITNSLLDLWSQMNFLQPGLMGTLQAFKRHYMQITDPEKDKLRVERLKLLVSPFIMRRRKADVEPDLPELSIEYRYCEMTPEQIQRYEIEKSAVRNELLEGIESGKIATSSVQVLRALIRMRQIACHPSLIDKSYEGDSGKLEEVMRSLETLREENQKALIFSSFVEHLKIFERQFTERGWSYSTLTGSTVNRERVINEYRTDPERHFFLISLKAGGFGLNLTEAGYVFLLDPWWNEASEMQAIGRSHRIGQQQKVIAYRFITKDTIEEKMLLLQQRKQDLSSALLAESNPMKEISREEAKRLFV